MMLVIADDENDVCGAAYLLLSYDISWEHGYHSSKGVKE